MNKKVLFIMTWGIGNCIMATPTIQAIYDLGFEIDIFASPVFPDQYDLLVGWDVINKIYLHPNERPDFDSYSNLIYHHPARSEPFSEYKKYKDDPRVIQNGHPDPFWPNEIQANLELAVKLGRNPFARDVPMIHVEYDEEWASFRNNKYEKKIIFAPTTHGKNDLWEPKMWHHWYDFIPAIAEERPEWEFWIVGTKDDHNLPPDEIDKSTNVKNVIGKLTIKETSGLIKGADLFVGNETGLSWVAEAIDTKALTLWTCTAMRKNWPQNHPSKKNERIVAFKKVCDFQPCHRPNILPGLWCPYIKAGQPHKCGYSFTTNQIYGLMLRMLGEYDKGKTKGI